MAATDGHRLVAASAAFQRNIEQLSFASPLEALSLLAPRIAPPSPQSTRRSESLLSVDVDRVGSQELCVTGPASYLNYLAEKFSDVFALCQAGKRTCQRPQHRRTI